MADYKKLFPFELVPQGANIVIYGAGAVGSAYLEQMLLTQYANVQCFLDRNAASYANMVIPIYTPEYVRKLSYDYIVLAFQTNVHYRAVAETLQSYGVPQEKIIIPPIRHHVRIKDSTRENLYVQDHDYAWQSGGLSAAIMLNLAVGDNIIRKKVIEALIEIAQDIRIDLYSQVAGTYLPWLYRGCGNIHSFIADGGGLYHSQARHYDLAMTLANFIQLDYVNLDGQAEEHPLFLERMRLLQQRVQEAGVDFSMPMNNFFARAIKQGKNCYTVFGYDGVFDIRDKNVHIELASEFQEEYEKLPFADVEYITINYGNAVSMTNAQIIAKQWPLEYLEEFVWNFKLKYQDIKVIQASGKDAISVQGADYKLIGRPLELTAHVLKHALFHLDIEGGLVHLATQLGTKCIVLFGPTQEKYFGYEQNINIKAGTCHDCYGMMQDINACAQGMGVPICMKMIKPQQVLIRADEVLRCTSEQVYMKQLWDQHSHLHSILSDSLKKSVQELQYIMSSVADQTWLQTVAMVACPLEHQGNGIIYYHDYLAKSEQAFEPDRVEFPHSEFRDRIVESYLPDDCHGKGGCYEAEEVLTPEQLGKCSSVSRMGAMADCYTLAHTVNELFKELTLNNHSLLRDVLSKSFISDAIILESHYIFMVLKIDSEKYERYLQTCGLEKDQEMGSYVSYLDTLIENFLEKSQQDLYYGLGYSTAGEMLRKETNLLIAGQDILRKQGLPDISLVIRLANLDYEGEACRGQMLFGDSQGLNVKFNLPVRICQENLRQIRKLLEMSGDNRYLLATSDKADGTACKILGLSELQTNEMDDKFSLFFSGKNAWKLKKGEKVRLQFEKGSFKLPIEDLEEHMLRDNFSKLFPQGDFPAVKKLLML